MKSTLEDKKYWGIQLPIFIFQDLSAPDRSEARPHFRFNLHFDFLVIIPPLPFPRNDAEMSSSIWIPLPLCSQELHLTLSLVQVWREKSALADAIVSVHLSTHCHLVTTRTAQTFISSVQSTGYHSTLVVLHLLHFWKCLLIISYLCSLILPFVSMESPSLFLSLVLLLQLYVKCWWPQYFTFILLLFLFYLLLGRGLIMTHGFHGNCTDHKVNLSEQNLTEFYIYEKWMC